MGNVVRAKNEGGIYETIELPPTLTITELPESVSIRLAYADAHGVIVDGLHNEEITKHIPDAELNDIAITLLDLLSDATDHYATTVGQAQPPAPLETHPPIDEAQVSAIYDAIASAPTTDRWEDLARHLVAAGARIDMGSGGSVPADTTQESIMPSPFLARRGPVTPTCETCGEARDDLETTEGYTECADCAGANGDTGSGDSDGR